MVSQLTEALKVRPEQLPERVGRLVAQLRDAQREIDRFRAGQVLAAAAELAIAPKDVFGVLVVTHNAGEAGGDDLRALALDVRGRLPADRPAVVAVGGVSKGRPAVVVATNDEARRWGVSAGELVKQAAGVLGGGGGGKAGHRSGRGDRRRQARGGAHPARARCRRACHRVALSDRRATGSTAVGRCGQRRVGVARSDPDGLLAVPVETVPRRADGADLDRISQLARQCDALEIVIGLPRSLAGTEGPAAAAARKYAVAVAGLVRPIPVRLVDERLSTVSAQRSLRDAGRSARRQRPVIDQAAAVVILQTALDAERASGRPPGSILAPDPAPEGPGTDAELGKDGPR